MDVKEFWKSVNICQSYDKKSCVLFFFWDAVYVLKTLIFGSIATKVLLPEAILCPLWYVLFVYDHAVHYEAIKWRHYVFQLQSSLVVTNDNKLSLGTTAAEHNRTHCKRALAQHGQHWRRLLASAHSHIAQALIVECYSTQTHTHTHTDTRLTTFCRGLPGSAGARKVNQSGFYWSKRQWVAVASAGPYASLHLVPDR